MDDDRIIRTRFIIALLGETKVGKTSIMDGRQGYGINESILQTIGIDFSDDNIILDGTNYKIKIYDTPGAERYKSYSRPIIKNSDGLIIVFSVDDRKSFELANDDWFRFIKEEIIDIEKKVIYLVANKIDLEKREVKREEAEEYAKNNKMKYFEISAKKGIGFKEIFI